MHRLKFYHLIKKYEIIILGTAQLFEIKGKLCHIFAKKSDLYSIEGQYYSYSLKTNRQGDSFENPGLHSSNTPWPM